MRTDEAIKIRQEIEGLVRVYMSLRDKAKAFDVLGLADFAACLRDLASQIEEVEIKTKNAARWPGYPSGRRGRRSSR